MKAAERKIAESGRDYARSIAPVSDDPSDPTPGSFRDSIHVEEDHDHGTWAIVADDPAAPYIEFGTEDTPAFRTLGRTAKRVMAQ